eukprot:4652220-Prymnesium_polylepis.1
MLRLRSCSILYQQRATAAVSPYTWRSEAAAPSGSPRGAGGGMRRRRASRASRPRTRRTC